MTTALTVGDNNVVAFDTAGKHTIGWNTTTGRVELNAGPFTVGSVVYGTDTASPLPPVATPGDWNFLSRVVYSDGGTTPDPGGNLASYHQIYKYGTRWAELWGAVIEARDLTGNPSSQTGVLQTLELDMFVNGADDLSSQIGRTVLPMVFGQHNTGGAQAQISDGISMNVPPGHNVTVVNPIRVSVPFSACGLDFHSSTPAPGAKILWGYDNTPIALDTAGNATVRWDANTQRFKVAWAGHDIFSIDTSGNLRITGHLTQGTAV